MKKQILFVGESLLRCARPGAGPLAVERPWVLSFASSGNQALDAIRSQTFDAIVSDLQLPGPSGNEVLAETAKLQPKALRFVYAATNASPLLRRCVGQAHQLLAKPASAETILAALDRAFAMQVWLPDGPTQNLVAELDRLPSPPDLYFSIVEALQSPATPLETVADLVKRDIAITAKLLQLANSAAMGLGVQVTEVAEAIQYLGVEVTKSLVLLAHSVSYFDNLPAGEFSVVSLGRHCLVTGNLARDIARLARQPAELTSQAFTAGLLHDLGKLLLLANKPTSWLQAVTVARESKVSLWEAERQVFGTTHADVGGTLLGIWGLPLPVVEAVALHHAPVCLLSHDFCPLTAVHAANTLANEQAPAAQMPPSRVDMDYLDHLGFAEAFEEWRTECRNYGGET